MKTNLLLFFFLITGLTASSQWELLYPKPTENHLMDVFFTDDLHGWAVGEKGTIVYTSDGGESLEIQISGTTLTLRSVFFTDPQTGWVVGGDTHPIPGEYIILHTDDGGDHWNIQASAGGACLRSVFFTDSLKGWAVGTDGAWFRTHDGGMNWIPQLDGSYNIDFNKVFFSDPLNGWIASSNNWSGSSGLYRTTDGGLTWTLQLEGHSQSVFFLDQNEGWAGMTWEGDGYLIHTLDGFITCDTIPVNDYGYLRIGFGFEEYYSLFFKDAQQGWIMRYCCSEGGWGGVFCWHDMLMTQDGGLSWEPVELPIPVDGNSMCFTTDGNGFVVGNHGTIFKSAGWDQPWLMASKGQDVFEFRSVSFSDDVNGWAVGQKMLSDKGPAILHTTDKGSNWNEQTADISCGLESVCFVDASHGWAVGGWMNTTYVIHTVDGGLQWELQYTDTTCFMRSVFFIDQTTGWTVGEFINGNGDNEGKILKTNNGGIDWELQSCDSCTGLRAVHFTDPWNGWAAGYSLYQTTNGGQTWMKSSIGLTYGYFTSVFFTDPKKGWVVGDNTLLHTVDGGSTWFSEENNYMPYSVHFRDHLHGMISCLTGKILVTKDGGINWEIMDSGTDNPLLSVCFSSGNSGFAVGKHGVIGRTDQLMTTVEEKLFPASYQNLVCYPNPSFGISDIRYQIFDIGFVTIALYDIQGKKIRTIVNGIQAPGEYMRSINLSDLPVGVYLIRLEAGNQLETQKLIRM